MADAAREQMIIDAVTGAARIALESKFGEADVAKAEEVCSAILGDKEAQGIIAPEVRTELVGTFGETAVSIGELLADAIVNGLDIEKIQDAVVDHLKSIMRKHLEEILGEEKNGKNRKSRPGNRRIL
jgi:hypothetical protein